MRETTVAASLLIDLLGHLADRVPREQLCRAAQLDPKLLADPDERVPGSVMERLWRAGEELSGDVDLGLHAAASHHPAALNILGYVILNCGTVGEVAEKLGRYAAILNDGLRVTITRPASPAGEDAICQFEAVEGPDNYLVRAPRHAMETIAAGIVCSMIALTRERILPREVSFRHRAPASVLEHARILGVTPRFGQPHNRVVFRATDWERPVLSAHPSLLAVFERHAQDMLAKLEQHGPVSRRLLQLLAKRLQGASPALPEMASALAMSPRNLQRALRDERTSFQALLDHARRELALRHLATPEGSAAEVAFLLGFADASAFTRAFRRWTGATPGAWRAQQRADGPAPRLH